MLVEIFFFGYVNQMNRLKKEGCVYSFHGTFKYIGCNVILNILKIRENHIGTPKADDSIF